MVYILYYYTTEKVKNTSIFEQIWHNAVQTFDLNNIIAYTFIL